jgi:RNA-directed DNA polymerase
VLLEKVARRVQDPDVMHLLKMMLEASGKKGVPQGGVISPVLSNIYLTEVDRMLERAKVASRRNGYEHLEYARYADDLVILVDGHANHDWLLEAVYKRLLEELSKLGVEVNKEKTRIVDLGKGGGGALQLPGIRLSTGPFQEREVVGLAPTTAREAQGPPGQTQGDIPRPSVTSDR